MVSDADRIRNGLGRARKLKPLWRIPSSAGAFPGEVARGCFLQSENLALPNA